MRSIKILAMALMLGALVTGCTTTSAVKPDQGAQAQGQAQSAQAAGAQTGGVAGQTQQQMDELDNPDSPLAERTIYFEFDKSDIQAKYLDVLTAHADYLMKHANVHIRLEGNTDERGSREYNIALGDRRAQAVRRFLMFQGVPADQITTVSYGEEKPADPGHDESAWAKNRRVDLVYLR